MVSHQIGADSFVMEDSLNLMSGPTSDSHVGIMNGEPSIPVHPMDVVLVGRKPDSDVRSELNAHADAPPVSLDATQKSDISSTGETPQTCVTISDADDLIPDLLGLGGTDGAPSTESGTMLFGYFIVMSGTRSLCSPCRPRYS